MKRLFFFVCLLGLAACDRPQYDLQMVCEEPTCRSTALTVDILPKTQNKINCF